MPKGMANVLLKCTPNDTSFLQRKGDWFDNFIKPLHDYGTLTKMTIFQDYFHLHFSRISSTNYQHLLNNGVSNVHVEHLNISKALLPRAVALQRTQKSSTTNGSPAQTAESTCLQNPGSADQLNSQTAHLTPSTAEQASCSTTTQASTTTTTASRSSPKKRLHNTPPANGKIIKRSNRIISDSSDASDAESEMSISLEEDTSYVVQDKERRRIKQKSNKLPRPIPGNLRPTAKAPTPGTITILLRPTEPDTTLHKLKYQTLTKTFGTILDTRTIRKGGLAIDLPPDTDITTFLLLTALDNLQLTCSTPTVEKYRSGIIGGVPLLYDESDLLSLLTENPLNPKIIRVQRLGRPDDPSRTIKIVFTGSSLPDSVTILNLEHPVLPYVAKPRQCFRCQRFFHTADECRSKARCLHCGGPHDAKECPKTSTHCVNCRGKHRANDPQCPIIKQAKLVCKIKATENVSMVDAREKARISYAAAVTGSSNNTARNPSTSTGPQAPAEPACSNLNLEDLPAAILALIQNYLGPDPNRDALLLSLIALAKPLIPALLSMLSSRQSTSTTNNAAHY